MINMQLIKTKKKLLKFQLKLEKVQDALSQSQID